LDDKDMPESDIEAAAKFVGADDFINKLPKKYDEPVLENGNNFSQGQRQLISFARVVTYKPSVVVLDEATANIDTETEVIIQNSLEKIKSIGTMVMVAHRLSTIKHASMIYVVDHGVIVESGNHQALLKKRGIYYNLYKLQTTEKDLAS
jgi:ATP-binding cassette subfamily B protein